MEDAPRTIVLPLDEPHEYTIERLTYAAGPLLLLDVSGGATLEILDGPPWEAESRLVRTVTREEISSTGTWIEEGAYVVSDVAGTIRASCPKPMVLDVLLSCTDPEHPRAKILRMLDRADVEVVHEAELVARRGGFGGRLSIPYRARTKVLEYLALIGMTVAAVEPKDHRSDE